jgi:hypothetical protein
MARIRDMTEGASLRRPQFPPSNSRRAITWA